MRESDYEKIAFRLGQVFKPATPINRVDLFSGRQRQIQDVIHAINQESQHVIVFGERGVGKTSLANILSSKIVGMGSYILMPHINCTAQDGFSEIWERVFAEIVEKIETGKLDLPESILETLKSHLAFGMSLSPDVIRRSLTEIGTSCALIVIIDEFDIVESSDARQTMADTLKFLSDKNVPGTVVLIGVADDVEDLIHQHESTERCLIQVPMPRMSVAEISSILSNGFSLVGMTIDADALKSVSYISKGLPYYPHVLGVHAGRDALRNGSMNVKREHIRRGIRSALDSIQASVRGNYRDAVSSSRKDAQYKDVLLACALARTDDFGFFAPVDVREPLSKIKKASIRIEAYARHLHAFSEADRGGVLERKIRGNRRPRFRFRNPLLQPYVLLKGVDEGIISDEDLEKATTPVEDESSDGETLF